MQVCSSCFKDIEIESYIKSFSDEKGICRYCNSKTEFPLIDIEELLDFFVEFLDLFESNEKGVPLVDIIEKDWELFANIAVSVQVLGDILPLIQSNLQSPYDIVCYHSDISENISYWSTLKERLKWERRYLSELDNIKDLGWDKFFNEMVTYSHRDVFYRARIHYDENEISYPKNEMGSPPKKIASEGRANPNGIPFLYLSKSKLTTLYETRALLHDEVSIGLFKVKEGRSISLVDFTEKASAFIGLGDLKNYITKILLKRMISQDLSRPIRRYDSVLEYVPTQFICEFLRYVIRTDGIVFNSSLHHGGQNIVLFDQENIECIEVGKVLVTGLNIVYEHQDL